MNLMQYRVKMKKTPFWVKADFYLTVDGHKFKIPVQETKGYYTVFRDLDSSKRFLHETDGKAVHISSFTLGKRDEILWGNLWSFLYDDVRNPKTGLLYRASEIIERYLS